MAITDENNMVMPVAPMYGNGGGWGNSFGNDWAWIIILLLCGWGNGGFGMGGFGGGFGNMMLGYDFPWLLNGQNGINANTNAGFDHAATQSALGNIQTAVTSGFGDMQTALCSGFGNVQNALCSGFAGTTAAVTGAQNALAQQMYSNEISNLNRSFAEQTANMQGFNGVQSQLAQCCCDNRAGIENLRFTVATEACADRAAISDALRDVIAANTASTQRILDQLCQDKIDSKNDTISQLRQELMFARGQASQDVQTAQILAGQVSEIDGVYNRLKNCPVPSVPIYGTQPVFTCNNGCGCGCGAA